MTSRLLLSFVASALIFFTRPGYSATREENIQFPESVNSCHELSPRNSSPHAVSAIATSEPQINVHVYDYSPIPDNELQKAEAEASLLFAHAGLRLIWIHVPIPVSDRKPLERPTPWPAGENLILNILPENRLAGLHCPLSELGFTSGVTSAVFVDRTREAARYLDPYVVLGHVIAHELGHALGLQHSRGLMAKNISGDWPVQAEQHHLQFFTKEAAQMQRAVREARHTSTD